MTGIISDNVGRTSGLIKAVSGGGGGVWTKIKTLTASSNSDLSFVDGTDDVVLDSTYPIYIFKFINCHPQTNTQEFRFNMSIDTGSNYNVTKTTTTFTASQDESGGNTGVAYASGSDLAQGTGFQALSVVTGNDNDASTNGNPCQ